MLTIGSLFSGIGGLELGLEWAGLGPTLWQCEIDSYCRGILAKHWPEVKRFKDVKKIDATAPKVDLLCGGFPCQDISTAGKGRGIIEGKTRSGLWYEYARIVGVLRPRYVVVENVSALLGRGMDKVLGDLSTLGYDAEWSTLRASDMGALHRRERVFIIAYSNRNKALVPRVLPVQPGIRKKDHSHSWQREYTETRKGGMDHGVSGRMDEVTRAAKKHWRRLDQFRVGALGNAVVPQCAEHIGRVIVQRERMLQRNGSL